MVVITSDNPRGERREDIIEQVLGGITDRSRTLVEPEEARRSSSRSTWRRPATSSLSQARATRVT